MTKYEFTGETQGRLRRIRALIDIPKYGIKAGDLGGWLESEKNLSHKNSCWVFDNGQVYDNGWVSGDSQVYGNGQVFDDGRVSGHGWVSGNGKVFGNGQVYDNGQVSGHGWVYDNGQVYGNGQVFDDGRVYGNGRVSGNGRVFGHGKVSDNGWVYGNGQVFDDGRVYGNGRVSGNMILTKKALVIDGLSQHVITVADNLVSIGCEVHDINTWLLSAASIGIKHDYSSREFAEYFSTLKYIKFMMDNYR